MVIPPAKTGRDSSKRTAVIKTLHTNRGTLLHPISLLRILIIVVIKFTAPKILPTPARWSLKIAKSTLLQP
jgi:cytochrome b561